MTPTCASSRRVGLAHEEKLIISEAEVARTEAEKQAHIKKWKAIADVTAAGGQILMQGAGTAQMAADLFVEGDKRAEKAKYAIGATEAFITGAVQQVKAIAAFASFNYVQGALHQAAAIFAFAQGGMLAAKAGSVGDSPGAASQASGVGASSQVSSSAGSGGSGSGGFGDETPIPPSGAPSPSGPAANEDPSTKDGPRRGSSSGNNITIHLNARVIDRPALREIETGLQDLRFAEGAA